MLMNVKCSAISSIAVQLDFDDGTCKNEVIALDDLVCVEYNKNGRRVCFEGVVIKIDASGTDPKSWYIILDGSGDFESNQARFSPMSILDLSVIRKANTSKSILSPLGLYRIDSLRIVDGRLQYTQDGFNWYPIKVDEIDINIKEEEGTIPDLDHHCSCHDEIKDENM